MKFTFSDSAIEYILKQINKFNENTYDIIIDYTDGNSPYNENISGCHCQVYDKYRGVNMINRLNQILGLYTSLLTMK